MMFFEMGNFEISVKAAFKGHDGERKKQGAPKTLIFMKKNMSLN